MKKFIIHYNYYATADVTVLANSKEEAIEKADQIEISNDEFDLEYDNREAFELEDVPELEEVIDKATAIIKKFNEGAGQEDFYSVPCYPTITTYCWNGDEMAKNKNTVVRVLMIETELINNIEAIVDITDTTVNGESKNLTLGEYEVPVLGGVVNE